jgi:hypothetical protein
VTYFKVKVNWLKKPKQTICYRRRSVPREGNRGRDLRNSKWNEYYRHACHNEVGLHIFIFTAINSDKIKRGLYIHTQAVKTRGLFSRFQPLPLEEHLISSNATVEMPPKTTPTKPPSATAFPFPLRLPVTSTSRTASLQFMLSISHP